MWTPKRIILLTMGLIVFVGAYLAYGRVLGRIDGLPSLPAEFWPPTGDPAPPPPPTPDPPIAERLQQAFGKDCKELKWSVQLELKSRGMVLTAGDFKVVEGNQVELRPLSVAIFSKNNPNGAFPEINTIRADIAYLTFDGPVTNFMEMGKRKIVAAQLHKNIAITNNRRTAEVDDDMSLFCPVGPVYYDENTHHIWTTVDVVLEDRHLNEKPTRAEATGMDVFLTTEAKAPAPGPTPPPRTHGQAGITGADRVALRSAVTMTLYVDAHSGFLSGDKDKPEEKLAGGAHPETGRTGPSKEDKGAAVLPVPPASAPPKQEGTVTVVVTAAPQPEPAPAKKAKVTIETPGPFNYDVSRDLARFDIPLRDPGQLPNLPENVVVTRFHDEPTIYDQLICDHLELQFRHRSPAPAAPAASPAAPPAPPVAPHTGRGQEESGPAKDREIETVHAWGGTVVMKSDAENFHATGNDFVHDARIHQSILKGEVQDGMFAIKDGNEIQAREMRLLDVKGVGTQVTAIGPGIVRTLDRESGKRTLEAHWKQTLVTSKDGGCDLLVLTGDATFLDPQTDPPQRLQADVLKVWLKAKEDKDKEHHETVAPPAPGERQDQRLQRLEAHGHVVCDSRDLIVPDCERLSVDFKDVAPENFPVTASPAAPRTPTPVAGALPGADALPGGTPTVGGAAPLAPAPGTTVPRPGTDRPRPASPVVGIPGIGTSTPAQPGAPVGQEPPRPIHLTARIVKATILRAGPRNVLDKLWTEGSVHVVQAPASPDDRGVDILGQTLDLTRKDQGNLLVVTGGDITSGGDDVAQLRLNKICIFGPAVTIDQATNMAWVDGVGGMEMESGANLRGEKVKEVVPLVVFWKKSMYFNGQWAEFDGGVQAEQDRSRLVAHHLQVCLDRTVSLKEGDKKDGPPPKVRTLLCDRDVHIEDATFENGQQVRYQRIKCPELSLENEDETINAFGPGTVFIIQPGDETPALLPNAPQGPGSKPAVPAAPPSPGTKNPTLPVAGNPGDKPAPNKEATARGKGDDVMKLTRVRYAGQMWGDNKKHLVTFKVNVEVFNLPGDNPDVVLDLGKLPAGCLYMHCENLQVLGVKNKQEMEATGRVTVQAREFFGRADKVTYNESKEQVILDGGEQGVAELYRYESPGGDPSVFRGRKIIYWRLTGAFEVDKARGATSGN